MRRSVLSRGRSSSFRSVAGWGARPAKIIALRACGDVRSKRHWYRNRGRFQTPALDAADAGADTERRYSAHQLARASEKAVGEMMEVPLQYEVSTWATRRGSTTRRRDQYIWIECIQAKRALKGLTGFSNAHTSIVCDVWRRRAGTRVKRCGVWACIDRRSVEILVNPAADQSETSARARRAAR